MRLYIIFSQMFQIWYQLHLYVTVCINMSLVKKVNTLLCMLHFLTNLLDSLTATLLLFVKTFPKSFFHNELKWLPDPQQQPPSFIAGQSCVSCYALKGNTLRSHKNYTAELHVPLHSRGLHPHMENIWCSRMWSVALKNQCCEILLGSADFLTHFLLDKIIKKISEFPLFA